MFLHIYRFVSEKMKGSRVEDDDEEDDDDTNDGVEVNFGSMRSTIHNMAMKFKAVIQSFPAISSQITKLQEKEFHYLGSYIVHKLDVHKSRKI